MDNLVNRTIRFDHTNKTIFGTEIDGYWNALSGLCGTSILGNYFDGTNWECDNSYGLLTPYEMQYLPFLPGNQLDGGKNIFQRIRLVGIVNEHCIGLAGSGNHLHSALDTLGSCQSSCCVFQADAQLQSAAQGGQGIVHRKLTGDRQPDRNLLVTADSRKADAVGKQFQITRERIRQIEAKALRKLRHPSRSKTLKDYLAN